MSYSTRIDWKSLWGVLWRVLFVCPVLWVVGFAWLFLVFGALIAPLTYAVCAFLEGDWLLGVLALAVWSIPIRFSKGLLGWTLQGFEYSGI